MTASPLIVRGARLLDGTVGSDTQDTAFLVTDGAIHRLGTVNDTESWPETADAEVIDVAGAPVVPGYVDIHHHGGDGVSFDDGAEAARKALAVHRAHGTTSSVLSYVTGDLQTMRSRLTVGAGLAESDPHILGLHAEGPFLHRDFRGAHDEALLRDPEPAAVRSLIDAAGGHLRQMTIAPEKPGGLDAVKELAHCGVVPAIGHTSADFDTTVSAFSHGARILTHSFNGMRGIHHRAPGPVVAALRESRIWLEVINDGIHVHPAVVASLFVEAPNRIVLVTDAMSATCSPDGDYMLGELEVTVADGVARLSSGDSLAGSTLTMDRAVANAVHSVGVPLDVAVAAATSHPAAAVGAENQCGKLAVGMPADFLVLNPQTLLPDRVFINGELQVAGDVQR